MLFAGANKVSVTDVSDNGNAGVSNIRRVHQSLIHDTGVLLNVVRILE